MKKIAIIGGSYLQLPAVKKAQELGFEVHCFSWREGAVCADVADYFYPISIVEKELILDECRRIKIDGITTIASDLAVLTVNYVAECLGLVANPNEFSESTTNKYMMRKRFACYGVPSPKFALVDDQNDYSVTGLKFPLIVKPTDRSGSRGVEKVLNVGMLDKAIERARNESFNRRVIVEEYVSGLEVSVESISYEGVHYVLQITDKVTTGAPYFVEIEHHQPSTLNKNIQQELMRMVPQALDALHIRYGASHSEVKITEDGKIYFIEIGARMGGDFIGSDLVRLSTGYDFLAATIKCAMGEFEPPQIRERHFSGVYFLSEETKHLRTIINHCQDYPEIVDAAITNTELHTIKCSSDRSGYIIYKGDSKLVL